MEIIVSTVYRDSIVALFPHQPTLHVTLGGKTIFEETRVTKKE
jgi:hypothetical protein